MARAANSNSCSGDWNQCSYIYIGCYNPLHHVDVFKYHYHIFYTSFDISILHFTFSISPIYNITFSVEYCLIYYLFDNMTRLLIKESWQIWRKHKTIWEVDACICLGNEHPLRRCFLHSCSLQQWIYHCHYPCQHFCDPHYLHYCLYYHNCGAVSLIHVISSWIRIPRISLIFEDSERTSTTTWKSLLRSSQPKPKQHWTSF